MRGCLSAPCGRTRSPGRGSSAARQKTLMASQGKPRRGRGGGGGGGGGGPRKEGRKVAFLFLTRGPLPLALLWAQFFRGHEGQYSIFIHTAEKFKYQPGSLPRPSEAARSPAR